MRVVNKRNNCQDAIIAHPFWDGSCDGHFFTPSMRRHRKGGLDPDSPRDSYLVEGWWRRVCRMWMNNRMRSSPHRRSGISTFPAINGVKPTSVPGKRETVESQSGYEDEIGKVYCNVMPQWTFMPSGEGPPSVESKY